jgi:hypothetical protein
LICGSSAVSSAPKCTITQTHILRSGCCSSKPAGVRKGKGLGVALWQMVSIIPGICDAARMAVTNLRRVAASSSPSTCDGAYASAAPSLRVGVVSNATMGTSKHSTLPSRTRKKGASAMAVGKNIRAISIIDKRGGVLSRRQPNSRRHEPALIHPSLHPVNPPHNPESGPRPRRRLHPNRDRDPSV